MRPLFCAWSLVLCSVCSLPSEAQQDAGLEKPSGPIYFESDINALTVALFIAELDERSKAGEPIVVVIDSGGGSVQAGEQMARAIERSPVSVACVVDGTAASMALYVLQSCNVRAMTVRSTLMGHNPAVVLNQSLSERDTRELGRVLQVMAEGMARHICLRARIDYAEYLTYLAQNQELWMSANEARELGFVDLLVTRVSR